MKAHSSKSRGRLVYGGNKSGKSTWGTIETVLWAQGLHPFRITPEPPCYIRIVTPDLPFPKRPHPIRDMLQDWVPPFWLRGRDWFEAWGDNARTLWFGNGSKIEFVSGGQEALTQAGAWHVAAVWFDEAIEESHYKENLLRLDIDNAAWFFTFCPLGEKPWIYDKWFSPKSEPADQTEIFQVGMDDNSHNLPEGQVETAMHQLLPHEIASRIKGEWSSAEGRVYNFTLPTTDFSLENLVEATKHWEEKRWSE